MEKLKPHWKSDGPNAYDRSDGLRLERRLNTWLAWLPYQNEASYQTSARIPGFEHASYHMDALDAFYPLEEEK